MTNDFTKLFKPKSVAVIGASRQPGKVGHELLKNIIESGYSGKIYPVNPKADEILGLKVYKSVQEIPDEVDLAIIAIPAHLVPNAVDECGKKGVKFAVVISAGFKEIGGEGIKREEELVSKARKYGIRIVGPNCLGIMDLHTPLNATFAASVPRKGGIAFVSQSGALLTAVLDWAVKRKIGFSRIISLGNKADLNEVDFIKVLGEDRNTKVILLYLESIIDGRKLIEIGSKVSKIKPIVLLKGGITAAGARAAMSHTGAMAGSATAVKAALKKAGILMANNVSELFNIALAFSNQPVPYSNRLGLVTNAGGVGVIASDLAVSKGLRLAGFSKKTIENLRTKLPPAAAIYNPVDVLGDAKADRYRIALETILDDPNVDGVLVLLTPQAMTEPVETAKVVIELNRKYPSKPILAVFMGGKTVDKAADLLMENGVPVYSMPEDAIVAFVGLYKYRELLDYLENISKGEVFLFDVDRHTAQTIIGKARKEGRRSLLLHEAIDLVRSYGIPAAPTRLALSEDEAVEIANNIGYPVVLKIASPDIIHKTDIGCVEVNLKSDREVREAYRRIIANALRHASHARIYGVEVQKMVPVGHEVIVGASRDPVFGPLIMFGMGGIYTELFRDVSFRIAPLSLHEAREMVMETKAYRILRGYRGAPPADVASAINVLLRISKLMIELPNVVEMDINPLFVYEEGGGSIAVDVKVIIS